MNNYLTTNDLCLRFGCSQQTIWRMIKDGRLIPPTFPGRPNKWLRSAVDEHEARLKAASLNRLMPRNAKSFLSIR